MISVEVLLAVGIVFSIGLLVGYRLKRQRVLKKDFTERLKVPDVKVEFSSWEQLLSFGEKLRKEGRYDEAVQLHQSMLADDQWQSCYQSIQFQLAEDFYFSGLYDRAERIYHLALETKEFHHKALLRLASIAARLRDWQRLSELLSSEKRLEGELAKLYVHSQCEIALRHREHGLVELADETIKRLQKSFAEHPRVKMMATQPAATGQLPHSQSLAQLLESEPNMAKFQQALLIAHKNGLSLAQLYSQLEQAGWLQRRYQCNYCGYTASQHYWQCPQCEHWETLKDEV
ncbi:hypothetical protein [Salinibius halmophilus]|uniref:hypothetical protein n=1 Tax=Salinibius halmophilus TaxID=1853216 RepID=UPI000E662638|nr:hypothetical protein [Salinibius halmophilus]